MESNHATNIRAIRETWAPGCDGFLAFSTKSDPRIPAISLPHEGTEEYNNMWQKVRSIWSFVGEHYKSDFDWFYIGGEDLFVIPQNLKNYLGTFDPSETHFLGRRFKGGGDGTYFNSGGSGYALSRASLQCLMENFDHQACSPDRHTAMEDVMIAQCLKKACNISISDTRDEQMRERFHPFAPASHYVWKHPVPPRKDWYEEYNKEWGLLLGKDCCAPDSIAFHYIKKPAMVRHLFHYLHWCKREL
jgi:glycoprotein-N-acetylgalactosamine 3-beta-galactosyltransferase